jgi:thiamine pyrophosphokinase
MITNLHTPKITATVVLGGHLDVGEWVKIVTMKSDFVIAADKGVTHCLNLSIYPILCVGDYDSIATSDLNKAYQLGWNIISFPSDKDMTDGALAIQEAINRGAQRIYLLAGFTGDNRVDHSLSHFFQIARFSETGIDIRMVDHDKQAYMLTPGITHSISGRRNASLSLIPIDKNVTGVSTKGLRYELTDESLDFGSTRSLSNEMLHQSAIIHIQTGLLLVVIVDADLIQTI